MRRVITECCRNRSFWVRERHGALDLTLLCNRLTLVKASPYGAPVPPTCRLECVHNPDLLPFSSPIPLRELWEDLITSDHMDVQQLLESKETAARSSHRFTD